MKHCNVSQIFSLNSKTHFQTSEMSLLMVGGGGGTDISLSRDNNCYRTEFWSLSLPVFAAQ